jgi:predicted PurR-regulated permease PerM
VADQVAERVTRRVILGLLLGGLLGLSYAVLNLFTVPVAWAIIIAFATWPLYESLSSRLPRHPTLSALIMTLLLSAAFVLPALSMAMLMRGEVASAIAAITAHIRQGPPALPEAVRSLPWIGPFLQSLLDGATSDPESFRVRLAEWAGGGADYLVAMIGDVGRNAGKLGLALFTVFFVYRDGLVLLGQVRSVFHRFLGPRVDGYLAAVGSMTKAVVWGLVLTALAQGFVAGLGYWWAGLSAPVLLSAMTSVIAMIPFGTPFAWGSIGV